MSCDAVVIRQWRGLYANKHGLLERVSRDGPVIILILGTQEELEIP